VRTVCVQFQPDRTIAAESCVRQAFRDALPGAEVIAGEDDGRYENIMFDVESPEEAMLMLRAVFDAPDIGRVARLSCIVTCQGEHGWEDHLLLHHYDRSLVLDAPATRPAE
jgi:hypothetical protein